MSVQTLVIALLGLGALLAMLRIGRRAQASDRAKAWLLLLIQPALALLLYLALFPPQRQHRVDELVLASAGTTVAQLRTLGAETSALALPEAPALPGLRRMPDLATALRQQPQVSRLRVLGQGLVARDRDALRTRAVALAFDPSPLPRGLVELRTPTQVVSGARWSVSGRVNDLAGGTVDLLDPAGRRIDTFRPARDGRFVLRGSAPAVGGADFALRLRDGSARNVERIRLPVQVSAGSPLRVLLLAGGPDPELKFLRRWALDAGADLHTQISVGAGLQLGDAPIAINGDNLRRFDLLVLDERAWRELGAARKAAVREALRAGLGVLLRIDGPVSPGERSELRGWGFQVATGDSAAPVILPPSLSDADAGKASTVDSDGSDSKQPVALSRQPVQVSVDDGVVLLRDGAGLPLSVWRNEGQGRIALWWLGDSHRLVLAGRAGEHGRLWGAAFERLARGHGSPLPYLTSADPRLHQRMVLCGLTDGAQVESGAAVVTLVEQRSSTGERCAAYWPATTGRQRLRSGESELPFFVRGPDEAPGLSAQANREATMQLRPAGIGPDVMTTELLPGPRWPWFLAWLLACGLVWWLERRQALPTPAAPGN